MRLGNVMAVVLVVCLSAQLSLAQQGRRILITEHGAVADGTTMNTPAIQKAIDSAAVGGGTVVIPAGTFLSGSIFLKPGVNLHIEKDGVLKGANDIAHYPKMNTRIEGHFEPWLPALVNADGINGSKITGEGTLDGSGEPFWTAFRTAIRGNRGTKNLDVPRPRLMFIANSNNIQVSGIRFKDSGFWNLHIYKCQDVLIENLDIRAGLNSPSADGIDVDSCQRVTIKGCYISTNDDCIAIKGTKGPLAMDDKDSPPNENIRISDCIFAAGNSFVTCGSEATIVRNVVLENCKTAEPGRVAAVLRLKMRTDTPQLYENMTIRNIEYNGTGSLIAIAPWTQYFDLQGHPQPTRSAKNITIQNVKGSFASIGGLGGGPGDTFENFTFENVDIQVRNPGARWAEVKNLVLKNVKINGEEMTGPPTPATQPAGGRGGRGRGAN